jgi:alcohol dehydrogenase class IV
MVSSFGFLRTPKIVFGAGKMDALADLLKGRGSQLLILTGSESFLSGKQAGSVMSVLDKEGFTVSIEKIRKEPSPDDIDNITQRYRNKEISAVIAVGGGSVMDAGKAVSAMLPVECRTLDYLEGVGTRSHPGIKKYFIAVPTTSGTGSEATANAVLSEVGMNGYKRSLRHENLIPDVAIVDPSLTLTCPPAITAAGGMDAFTQLVESYLSLKACPLSDSLAVDGIRNIHACLQKAVINGDDIKARSGMSYAAMLSGITLANAGLGLVHGFASSTGGFYNIPHGMICGTLMAVVNRYMIEALLGDKNISVMHEKYGLLGKIFSGVENKSVQWYMQYAADYMDELTETLNISRLGRYGIGSADCERIAANTDHKSNPVRFGKEQLEEMLMERL